MAYERNQNIMFQKIKIYINFNIIILNIIFKELSYLLIYFKFIHLNLKLTLI